MVTIIMKFLRANEADNIQYAILRVINDFLSSNSAKICPKMLTVYLSKKSLLQNKNINKMLLYKY